MSALLLSVYVVRKDTSQPDDKIHVRREGDQMVVTHRDGVSNTSSRVILRNQELPLYVKNLCKLFVTDTDPFDNLQFNFAGFPTHMATRESLLVPSVVENLSSIAMIVTKSAFDEEDNEDEDEDEFANMPPLCNAGSCDNCVTPCYVNNY